MQTIITHRGHNNGNPLVLMADGKVPPIDSLTNIALEIGPAASATVIDILTYPDVFDLSQTVSEEQAALPSARVRGIKAGDPLLVLYLGSLTESVLAAGTHTAKLVLYDSGDETGIVWDWIRLVID